MITREKWAASNSISFVRVIYIMMVLMWNWWWHAISCTMFGRRKRGIKEMKWKQCFFPSLCLVRGKYNRQRKWMDLHFSFSSKFNSSELEEHCFYFINIVSAIYPYSLSIPLFLFFHYQTQKRKMTILNFLSPFFLSIYFLSFLPNIASMMQRIM